MTGISRRTTVAMTDEVWASLRGSLDEAKETAWTMRGSLVENEVGESTIFIKSAKSINDEAYDVREPLRLSIKTSGWVPELSATMESNEILVFAHSHPMSSSVHSEHDIEVDSQIYQTALNRGDNPRYASIVIGGSRDTAQFCGRVVNRAGEWRKINRLRVAGSSLVIINDAREEMNNTSEVFDRQVRAFGEEGQRALSQVHIGVVGCGGTGSSVVEQLIRLGVGRLTVIDSDYVEASNVTRLYGTGIANIGSAKVEVMENLASTIGLGTQVKAIEGRITEKHAAQALSQCDVVFGCTDDNAGRIILARIPQAHNLLLIDCGVVIDSREGRINEIIGRISVVGPRMPCLVCMREVDQIRADAELLSPDEYKRLAHEGYVPNLETRDPSVLAFTTATASMAINEMLGRLFGYVDAKQNRILIRYADRSVSRQYRDFVGSHRCQNDSFLGAGTKEPYLQWGWPDAS